MGRTKRTAVRKWNLTKEDEVSEKSTKKVISKANTSSPSVVSGKDNDNGPKVWVGDG